VGITILNTGEVARLTGWLRLVNREPRQRVAGRAWTHIFQMLKNRLLSRRRLKKQRTTCKTWILLGRICALFQRGSESSSFSQHVPQTDSVRETPGKRSSNESSEAPRAPEVGQFGKTRRH